MLVESQEERAIAVDVLVSGSFVFLGLCFGLLFFSGMCSVCFVMAMAVALALSEF